MDATWCARVRACVIVALAAEPAFAAAKTDVVVLRNGDRITGEVQQLERGHLAFKTDDIGTLQIEWDKVQNITATAPFDVDDVSGNRYLGSLESTVPGQVVIAGQGKAETVALARIARIRRLDTSFWKRLDGSIDAGASYTSATELFTLDVAATLKTERPGYEISTDANATITTQPEVEDTRRSNVSLSYTRRFPDRWVALFKGQLEQNRELGFDLRSAATAGGGRFLAQSARDRLLVGIGISLNRELPVSGEKTTNVEAVAALTYDRFSYDYPNVDISIAVAGFTSLSDSGRSRLELNASLKRELVKDFYATLRGHESYDSRPATAGAQRNDYGITFALGWTF